MSTSQVKLQHKVVLSDFNAATDKDNSTALSNPAPILLQLLTISIDFLSDQMHLKHLMCKTMCDIQLYTWKMCDFNFIPGKKKQLALHRLQRCNDINIS